MADNLPEHPALKGFSRPTETVKHVLGKTLKTALKGALIGGMVLGALALPVAAIPAVANFITGGFVAQGAASSLIGYWLVGGALAGMGIGGAIGLVSGVNGAHDAVDDEAQDRISKYTRSQQLAANQEMMAINMERLRASKMGGGMGGPSHGLAGMSGKKAGMGAEMQA